MSEFRKLKSLKFLYEINEEGVIRNVKSKKIRTPRLEKKGYMGITFEHKCLGRKHTTVHRLLAEAFIPNPLGLPEVNHIDGNKLNNSLSNLEWIDHSGNMKHAYSIGINRKPLRDHSEATRVPITNGTQDFESISEAAKWLVEQGLTKNFRSGVSGISQNLHGKRTSMGGYKWKCI